jgi:hypothetical protein
MATTEKGKTMATSIPLFRRNAEIATTGRRHGRLERGVPDIMYQTYAISDPSIHTRSSQRIGSVHTTLQGNRLLESPIASPVRLSYQIHHSSWTAAAPVTVRRHSVDSYHALSHDLHEVQYDG